jgi:hypothetical protein
VTSLTDKLSDWWSAYSLYVALALVAIGLYLLLPRRRTWGRAAGVVASVIGLGLVAARLPLFAGWFQQGVFWSIAFAILSTARSGSR